MALSYEGSLLVGAVSEIIAAQSAGDEKLLEMLAIFQKCLKYGLPTEREVILYEMGFADRLLAQTLAATFAHIEPNKHSLRSALRTTQIDANAVLSDYPSLFTERLAQL